MPDAPTTLTGQDRLIDEYLVVAAQSGDRRSLARLAARWQRRLIAHAWRLTGERSLAEDAAQSAWIDIVRGLPRLRDERAFPAWAYRITSRKAARAIAMRIMQRRRNAPVDESIASDDPSAFDTAGGADVRRAVAALPPAHRAAVALFYFDGLSVAETAVALDVPAGTVKSRLMHARAKLRAYLEGDDDA